MKKIEVIPLDSEGAPCRLDNDPSAFRSRLTYDDDSIADKDFEFLTEAIIHAETFSLECNVEVGLVNS